MGAKKQSAVTQRKKTHKPGFGGRSAVLAKRGVKTGVEFAGLMSALMSDVLTGEVSPQVAHAACAAGSKLLRVTELQHRYRNVNKKSQALMLVGQV